VAAGFVLVAEAGGHVTAIDGGPPDPFRHDCLVTNGRLHTELGRLIHGR
jgi:fructose-1,6-bisphosphatase/inositol monophosphatase family enzyme